MPKIRTGIFWVLILFLSTGFLYFIPKTVFATFTITSVIPSEINSPDVPFTVAISVSSLQSNPQYLQLALTAIDKPTNLLGITQNNVGGWYFYKSDPSASDLTSTFYSFTHNNGSWVGQISGKVDVTDNGYIGPGQYSLRLYKYTISSTGNVSSTYTTWSSPLNINISAPVTPTNISPSIFAPTLSPTPTFTPTQTPTPTPSSGAIYKINEVKDGEGTVLSSVKIYVDGNYVHHYAPENLEFCDNCQCYEGVSCGLGSHTITLEKSGYNVWGKTITLGLDDTLEENPVMDKGSFPLPTSNPVKVNLSLAGQSGTPRENKNPTPTSSLSAKILGLGSQSSLSAKEASASELFAAPETKDAPFSTAAAGWQRNSSGLFLLLGGMSLLICSTIVWWKKRVSASSIFGSR